MEIINTYGETLSHYRMKLNYVEEELRNAGKGMVELELLTEEGFQGPAGSALSERLMELGKEAAEPLADLDQVQKDLVQMGGSIEEELQALLEQGGLA